MKNTVSRAGDIISRYMEDGKNNPFHSNFDWFLKEAKKKDITLILGSGFRAGCLHDSLDDFQMYEANLMEEFSEQALENDVKIITGIYGHTKYDISKLQKIRETVKIPTGGLGPLLTDIGTGYDHINAAIGIVALRDYIDWVSLITPAEHMGLPTLQDCQDGMSSINLARHIVDVMKNKNYDGDLKISEARNNLDWESMREYSINPYSTRWNKLGIKQKNPCTLCGPWCPLLYNNGGKHE